jgi:hypothetical protein
MVLEELGKGAAEEIDLQAIAATRSRCDFPPPAAPP